MPRLVYRSVKLVFSFWPLLSLSVGGNTVEEAPSVA